MPFDPSPAPAYSGPRTSCAVCPSKAACLAGEVAPPGLARWDAEGFTQVPLPTPGKLLFAAGDPANAIYVVRAGCVKTFTVDEDGNERVRGFHFPGDFVGLDAIGSSRYPSQAVAVTPSQVCRINKGQIHRLQADAPELVEHLLARVAVSLEQALSLSGDYTADQRVAAFLLQMLQRQPQALMQLNLPMTRRDIANYLRLATETVCRVLTRFENRRMVRIDDRRVDVLDAVALRRSARPLVSGVPESRGSDCAQAA